MGRRITRARDVTWSAVKIGIATVGISTQGKVNIMLACEMRPSLTATAKSVNPRIFQATTAAHDNRAPRLMASIAKGAVMPINASPIPAGIAKVAGRMP